MTYTGIVNIAAMRTGVGVINSNYKSPGGQSTLTKSAVIGMMAAAMGRTRDQSIDDLNDLKIATVVINSGIAHKQFSTIFGGMKIDGKIRKDPCIRRKTFYQSHEAGPAGDHLIRHLVFFESEDKELVEAVLAAFAAPVFPVYIGRKTCLPVEPMAVGSIEGSLNDGLALVKTPAMATVEVEARSGITPMRRIADVIDGLRTRRSLSRMVTTVALNPA